MATAAVRTLQNFIDGEYVDAAGDETFAVVNPATGEHARRGAALDRRRTSTAPSQAAHRAFETFGQTTPGDRATMLLKLADAIDEHAEEIAELEVANAGKPIEAFKADEIPVDVRLPALLRRRRAHDAGPDRRRVPRGLHVDDPPRAGRRRRPDHAVELPADDGDLEDRPGARGRQHDRHQAGRDDAAVDAAARRARRRHPAQGRAERRHRRGRDRARRSSRHPDVDMVAITGSVESGKKVAAAAADTLKRVHLELGGKAPVVVFDDADMETAMETIAGTGYYNAGQDCTAATRVLAVARTSTTTSSAAWPSRPRR